MKILAFDTSTENLSVALWLDGQIVSQDCPADQRHTDLTLPMIRRVLDQAGLSLAQLDAIAYGCGPGSFTGLRIGCGIAQGLAYACELPLLGIVSLLALAEASGHDKVYACLDARMGQIFCAAYERQPEGWVCRVEPTLCQPQQLPAVSGDGWAGIGSGFRPYEDILRRQLRDALVNVDANAFPHAAAMARLAAKDFAAGKAVPPEQANLLYLRDKVALTISEQPRK